MFARPGFGIARHAVSSLQNGEFGWVQAANFLALIAGRFVLSRNFGKAMPNLDYSSFLAQPSSLVLRVSTTSLPERSHSPGFPPSHGAWCAPHRCGRSKLIGGGVHIAMCDEHVACTFEGKSALLSRSGRIHRGAHSGCGKNILTPY